MILLIVSIGFESLFIHHGLNPMDEGWPLHAAMELQDGKTLYDEVFWVFPPGHLLAAQIAYAFDPPGLVGARIIYAAFDVALCLSLFFVARKIMPDDFALVAGLFVAIAAPWSHCYQLLFGYRYLVWSTIALLFFHRRLTSDDSRWLFAAGVAAAVALFFRLTPAFAVSAAIGVGVMAATRNWRRWVSDWLWFAAGLVLLWIPILLWFQSTVGLERLWSEMVVRPVEMTRVQSLPLPPLWFPGTDRNDITSAFSAFGFRFYLLLYVCFIATLLLRWGRAVRDRRRFDDAFLLTFVLFGAIFFVRSMGRSDIPHLDSAIPPIAVLLVYSAYLVAKFVAGLVRPAIRASPRITIAAKWAFFVCLVSSWSFLNGSEQFFDRNGMMGDTEMETTRGATFGATRVWPKGLEFILDPLVFAIQERTEPGDSILSLYADPLIYVLAERHSPGYFDVIMPGTFRSPEELRIFIEHLEVDPPAVVIWPRRHFDDMPSRGLEQHAPQLAAWVLDRYRFEVVMPMHGVMVPREGVGRDLPLIE